MSRRLLTLLAALAALVGVVSVPAGADSHFTNSVFTTGLSGANEVPANTSAGSGFSSVTVSEDGTALAFRLYVNDLDDVTMAHIHVGTPDENGPVQPSCSDPRIRGWPPTASSPKAPSPKQT
jgi:CHRD domain